MGGLRKQFCLINSQQWLNEEMIVAEQTESQTSSHHCRQDLTEEIMNERSIDMCNNDEEILANDAGDNEDNNDNEDNEDHYNNDIYFIYYNNDSNNKYKFDKKRNCLST